MASKSKRRRRVLGASCILAALIVAGSSFAWFTSKDEVTNRLTANADYGVSIVESFAPPANWLPGQEINKDVYAVNTGNIAAFVKEELSGVLDYSYETLVSKFEAGCVQLVPMANEDIDGATTNEAGSFLAWTDTSEPTGFKKSVRNEDDADPAEAWHPTKDGHYIFRRSIGTKHVEADPTNNVEEHDETIFTYAGYYFVKGTTDDVATTDIDEGKDRYYKIVIGNDTFRAANDGANPVVKEDGTVRYEFDILCKQEDLVSATSTVDPLTGDVTVTPAAITPNEDGTFTEKPVISYVKVVDLDPQDVSFTYNEGTTGDDNKYDGAPYLMVRYSNAQGDLAARAEELETAEADLAAAKEALIAAQEAAAAESHTLAELEVTYRNAEYDYYTSLARYNKTKADMDYANELIRATNKLYEPAFNRANAEKVMEKLKQAMEDAAKRVRAEANKEQGEISAGDGVTAATAYTTPNFNAVKADMLDTTANTTKGIGSSVLVPQTIRDLINNNTTNPPSATPGGSDLTQAKANLAVLDSIWTQIAGTNGNGDTDGILKKITDDYDKFQDTVAVGNKETDTDPDILDRAGDPSHDIAQGYLQDLNDDLVRLEELLDAYAAAYTEFVANTTGTAAEESLTDLTNALEDTIQARIGTYSEGKETTDNGSINDLKGIANLNDSSATDSLKKAIAAYDAAYDAYYGYMADATTNPDGYYAAVNAWNTAVSTYNDEVNKVATEGADSAKENYDNTISTTPVSTKNLALVGTTVDDVAGGGKKLHSDGTALVKGFSAHSIGNNPASPAADSNLTARPAGIAGAVSTSDDITDPRIIGDDTKYLKYVLNNTAGTNPGEYDSSLPFDASTNTPYKQMSAVTEFNTTTENFYQLGADPAGTGATKQLLSALNSDLGTDKSTFIGAGTIDSPETDSAKEKYDSALAAATAIAGLTAAEDAVTAAEAALDAARIAQAVQNDAASNINIDVVLDGNVVKSSAQPAANATWVFDEATDGTQTPTFYYNRILDAGETSEKLVDKLVFCDTVTAKDFTELTFDLNVALDSMQVTYDPQDNVTMTTTAVNASDDFDMKATITNQTDKSVTWDAAPAVATVYKVGDDEVTINTLAAANKVTVGNTTYTYQIDGTDFYGVTKPEAGSTATYYKIDTTGATPVLVTGEGSTVTVTATAG